MAVRTRISQALDKRPLEAQDIAIFQFGLEDEVRDRITGFQGVVVSRTEWNNGCIRYALQPRKLDKEGKPIEAQIFDQGDLVLVKAAKPRAVKPTEGPPPRGRDPRGRA